MMNLVDKRPRINYFNCAEFVYEDPQRKEIRLDGPEFPHESSYSSENQSFQSKIEYPYEREDGVYLNGNEIEGKSQSEREFTFLATEVRKNFYCFHKAAESVSGYTDSIFSELKKNLTFKIPKILDHQSLADYFERQLFKLAKHPKQARKNWSEEETTLLISIIAYYCVLQNEDYANLSEESWKYIASIYPGKKIDQIKTRWHSLYKLSINKAPWHAIEDELLLSIVKEKGPQHWKEIALELSERSGVGVFRQGKQCRERWINHLDPNVKKGNWTEEEDIQMLNLFLEKGKKWAEIAKRLGGRTENNVKNRWVSLIRKYKSELEIHESDSNHENDDSSHWEQKLATTILSNKMQGTNKEETKLSDSFSPIKEFDEHDHNTSSDTFHSSNHLSPKSSQEDQAARTQHQNSKKSAEKRKGKNLLCEFALKPNVEEKQSLKDKLLKCPKLGHDFKNFHEQPFDSQSARVLQPKSSASNSVDSITERMQQLPPSLSYQNPNYTYAPQQIYNVNEQNARALPYAYRPSQQTMTPYTFGNNGLMPANCYSKSPSDDRMIPEKEFSVESNKMTENYSSPMQFCSQSSNLESRKWPEEETFHLAKKELGSIPLEAQPDKDHLYFAVIDTKTHEIYLMNQVTQANYGQTFDAINAENQLKNISDVKDPWTFDARPSIDQELPELSMCRDESDFLFGMKQDQ